MSCKKLFFHVNLIIQDIKEIKMITRKQSEDTGMAMTLLALLIGNVFLSLPKLNILAIVLLVVTMSVPTLFKPVAVVWFGLSHAMGVVVSKIMLGSIFYLFVTPMGQLVSLFRKDPMSLKAFKQSKNTVFKKRNHIFTKQDLEYPY